MLIFSKRKLRKTVDKDGNVVYNCEYDALGNVSEIKDENNVIQYCVADNLGRLITQIITEDNAVSVSRNLTYKDDSSGIVSQEHSDVGINGLEKGKIYSIYSKDSLNRPTSTSVTDGTNGYKVTYEYYPKQRQERVLIQKPSLTPGVIPKPTYQTVTKADGTTGLVKSVKTYDINAGTESLSKTETVVYDANGNITQYGATTYEYDNLNRLTRENNADLGKTYLYKYELRDNLTSKIEYNYTTEAVSSGWTSAISFSCDDKDRVIYKGGSTVTYDEAGNITSIGSKTLNWQGSRVSHASDSRGNSTIFYYPNGTIKDIVFEEHANFNDYNLISRVFSYLNGQLYCESLPFCKLYYVYNEQGIAGFYLSNKPACYFFKEGLYTFRKNLFGDITDIYYGDTRVASYKYDAWGNCTVENFPLEGTDEDFLIGNINPFRYRGYYWCEALQMYHLQTRWYDPTMCRFISPDSYEYLDTETFGGLNLYAYCLNNPVMYTDPTGHSVTLALLIGLGVLVGGAVGFVTSIITQGIEKGWDEIDLRIVAIDTLFGAIDGALAATGIGVGASLLINPLLAATQVYVSDLVTGQLDSNTVNQMLLSMAFSIAMIGISSALTKFSPINIGYNSKTNAGIYDTSKSYLKTAKSARKKALYKSKKSLVIKNVRNGLIGYSLFTSAQNIGLWGVNHSLGW